RSTSLFLPPRFYAPRTARYYCGGSSCDFSRVRVQFHTNGRPSVSHHRLRARLSSRAGLSMGELMQPSRLVDGDKNNRTCEQQVAHLRTDTCRDEFRDDLDKVHRRFQPAGENRLFRCCSIAGAGARLPPPPPAPTVSAAPAAVPPRTR